MLTYRERVMASITRQGMDAIPWQFDLTSAVVNKLKIHYGTEDVFTAIGDHIMWVGAKPRPETAEMNPEPKISLNEFGTKWRHSEQDGRYGDVGALVDYPLKEPNLGGFKFPEVQPGIWEDAPKIRAEHPGYFLLAPGIGLFESAWALCGFENYLSYIAGEPSFVEDLTEKLADYSCQITAQLAGKGVDGIRFGDDWGFQDRLMVRPEVWRRLFKKHYQRIYSEAHKAGLIVMIHSCGNITELLRDYIGIGVQVVNPLQPEAMDVAYCQKEFGKDLTFWGGLGSQSTLPLGSVEDCAREARHRLELFKDGGYILAPAGAAPTDTPAENIAAIVEVAKAQLEN